MINEIRCTCKFSQLLFKVVDANIEIKCRGCKGKKLISIKKLLTLKANDRLKEVETNNESKEA